jgi:hypothetical protein
MWYTNLIIHMLHMFISISQSKYVHNHVETQNMFSINAQTHAHTHTRIYIYIHIILITVCTYISVDVACLQTPRVLWIMIFALFEVLGAVQLSARGYPAGGAPWPRLGGVSFGPAAASEFQLGRWKMLGEFFRVHHLVEKQGMFWGEWFFLQLESGKVG